MRSIPFTTCGNYSNCGRTAGQGVDGAQFQRATCAGGPCRCLAGRIENPCLLTTWTRISVGVFDGVAQSGVDEFREVGVGDTGECQLPAQGT